MDWTVLVVDWNSLGPAKFYLVMMGYIAILLYRDAKYE
jgi:hypothetical protein